MEKHRSRRRPQSGPGSRARNIEARELAEKMAVGPEGPSPGDSTSVVVAIVRVDRHECVVELQSHVEQRAPVAG